MALIYKPRDQIPSITETSGRRAPIGQMYKDQLIFIEEFDHLDGFLWESLEGTTVSHYSLRSFVTIYTI